MLERAPGRLLAGGIAIEAEHQVLADAEQRFDLAIVDRGAERRHRGVHAVLGERHHVHVALGDEDTIDVGDRFLEFV